MKHFRQFNFVLIVGVLLFSGCDFLFEDRYPHNTGKYIIPKMENHLQT